MSASPASRRSAFGLLAAVIVLWGLNWPLMKFGLRHMAPLTFVTARMGLAALCMVGFVAARGRLHRPSRQDWLIVLWIGGVQMASFTGLITVALQYVEAGRSAILSYTTPLWVVPGAILLLGERLAGRRLAGFLTGMAGVGVLFNPFGFNWSSRTALIGNGLLMLAAMLWAAVIVAIKRHPWRSPALDLAPWHFLVATLAVAPFALAAEAGRPVDWGWELGGILAYNGLAATAFCYLAVIAVNRTLPAITTALGMLGVPVAGLASSAILLGEPVSASEAAGLGLIIAGLALVALGDSRETADPDAPSLQG